MISLRFYTQFVFLGSTWPFKFNLSNTIYFLKHASISLHCQYHGMFKILQWNHSFKIQQSQRNFLSLKMTHFVWWINTRTGVAYLIFLMEGCCLQGSYRRNYSYHWSFMVAIMTYSTVTECPFIRSTPNITGYLRVTPWFHYSSRYHIASGTLEFNLFSSRIM